MGTSVPPAAASEPSGEGGGGEAPPADGGEAPPAGEGAQSAGGEAPPAGEGAQSGGGEGRPGRASRARAALIDPRRPRPIFLLLGLLLALGMTIGLVVGFSATRAPAKPSPATVPSFSLPRVGGSGKVGVPLDGGGDGHPAILLFFASWCGPCQKEIPALSRVYDRQHAGKSSLNGVSVIGVDGSDPTKNALAFMKKSKISFPVGADEVYAVTQGKFGFTGLPESVFVDANGTIAGVHYGALSTSDFVSWERKLLATG